MTELVNTYETIGTTDDLDKRIEDRLKKQQEKREFRDTGVRTGWSRKERAAFQAVLNSGDIENLEKDEGTAIELVKKQRVFPKIDLEAEQDNGVEPGCAYLKDWLQKSYMSKPLKNTAEHREIYIKVAEFLQEKIKEPATIENLKKNLQQYGPNVHIYNEIIAPATKQEKSEHVRVYHIVNQNEKYLSKSFINVLDAVASGYGRTKAMKNHLSFAIKANGVTKHVAEEKFKLLKEHTDNSTKEMQRQINSLSLAYDLASVKKWYENECSLRGGFFKSYLTQRDVEGFKKYAKEAIERFIKRYEDDLKPENLRWGYKETPPDWSWAFGKKEKTEKTKKTEITINSGLPLEHIKRTGGYKITQVNEKAIVSDIGFKGVTLGNYLKDEEAREHIRHFLGAITDLMEVLDLPQSINEELNIGFGAYGRGGTAMASYIFNAKAINLTKKRGDGTVAHEYAHFLDDYLNGFNREQLLLTNKVYHLVTLKDTYYARYLRSKKYTINTENLAEMLIDIIEKETNNDNYAPKFIGRYRQMFLIMAYIRFGILIKSKTQTIKDILQFLGERGYKADELLADIIREHHRHYKEEINDDKVLTEIMAHVIKVNEENKASNNNVSDIRRLYGRDHKSYTYRSFGIKNDSSYFRQSADFGSKYWFEPHELFARAFETYMYDRLEKQNRSNNYLVSGGYFNRPVYPQGIDRTNLYELYDVLVKEIRATFDVGFVPFTTERVDEYIALDESKDDQKVKTGVIATKKENELEIAEAEMEMALAMMEIEKLECIL